MHDFFPNLVLSHKAHLNFGVVWITLDFKLKFIYFVLEQISSFLHCLYFLLAYLTGNLLISIFNRSHFKPLSSIFSYLKDPSQPQYLVRAKCNIPCFIGHLNSGILYVEKKSSSILVHLLYWGLELPQTHSKII